MIVVGVLMWNIRGIFAEYSLNAMQNIDVGPSTFSFNEPKHFEIIIPADGHQLNAMNCSRLR